MDALLLKCIQFWKQQDLYTHDVLVIFKFGTAVRVEDEMDEFNGFDESYHFPTHRLKLKSDLESIMSINIKNWTKTRSYGESKFVSQAYKCLVNAGYPSPGDSHQTTRTVPASLDVEAWSTSYENHNPEIQTLTLHPLTDTVALDALIESHKNSARVARRYDYMMPEVVRIIKNHKIHQL